MDADCWALYSNDTDVTQERVEEDTLLAQLRAMQQKYGQHADELNKVRVCA